MSYNLYLTYEQKHGVSYRLRYYSCTKIVLIYHNMKARINIYFDGNLIHRDEDWYNE